MSIAPISSSPVPVTPTAGKPKDVPPGLDKRGLELPPGIAKKLENGGSPPPGIAKRFPAAAPTTEPPVAPPAETTTPTNTAPTASTGSVAAATEPGVGERLDLSV